MRNNVSVIPIGELCDVLDSKRKPITKKDRRPGPYPYYGATGLLDKVDGYLFDEPLVLIGEDGAKWGVGERTAFMADGRYWVNNHAHVIRPYRDIILDSWIIYYLNTSDLSPFITGLTVPKLNQGKLREIPIPVPPLPEQKRIVAILDEAFAGIDAAIANTQKNLTNARELFESYLNSVFERNKKQWPIVALGDISEVKGGKRLPKGYKPQLEETNYPYIRVADFDNKGGVNLEKMRYISEDVYKTIKRYDISSNDVFITIVGATIGKSGIVPKKLDGANLTENACKLVLKENLLNTFVYYFTRTNSFYEQVGLNTRVSAQPKLALVRLKTINLAVPPHNIQESLVAKIDRICAETQRIESIHQQKLNSLNELKQSLLQKAFSGELTAEKKTNKAQVIA